MGTSSLEERGTPTVLPKNCKLLCENIFDEENFNENDDETLLKRRQPTMLHSGKKLLAPLPRSQKKYTVVFDLDETVVYARDGPLYARAHLRGMLRSIKNDFEVIVWTAGERDYAKNVLAEINVDYIIQHLVYRHKKWFHEDDYTKDLRQLGRDLEYTILIENTPDCVRANPENSIIVANFEVLRSVDPVPTKGASMAAHRKSNSSSCSACASERKQSNFLPSPSRSEPDRAGQTPATDRTLYLLKEVLLALAKSGKTVPAFLASCELLSKQMVVCSDNSKIPIYYLGTCRRRYDAEQLKEVHVNLDKVPLERPRSARATTWGGRRRKRPR